MSLPPSAGRHWMKEQGRSPEPAGTAGVVLVVVVVGGWVWGVRWWGSDPTFMGGAEQQERRLILQEHSVQFADER